MVTQYEFDVVVVGSGGAGLTAALAAADAGCKTLLLESTDKIGGSTSLSGGGVWIPNNSLMKEAGIEDSFEAGLTYLNSIALDDGPASSPQRREAYLRQGPEMVEWLKAKGFRPYMAAGYPDYYPEKPGGTTGGRCIEGDLFNMKELGEWKQHLRVGATAMPVHANEGSKVSMAMHTWEGFKTAVKAMGGRNISGALHGGRVLGMGAALAGQLLKLCLENGVEIWRESPFRHLIIENGEVVGVVAEHDGAEVRIAVRSGVMLAAGGFEHNQAMRDKYQKAPVHSEWSVGSPGNVGDGINAGIEVGAATAYMADAWWMPSLILSNEPGAEPWTAIFERSMPHSMVVGQDGKRFTNEAQSYLDFGYDQYAHDEIVSCVPAWMILDSQHRKTYMLGMNMPGMGTKKLIEEGVCWSSDTLEGLAEQIGVDAEGLVASAEAMNEYARTGVDPEFHRGASEYDHFYSDPKNKPNPNLGSICKPPFYALKMYPGDLGTMGGLVTDEHARVLREDGSVIPGLYAAGNNAASVMGRTYPGPGSTIGPGMVFGMIGAQHMAKTRCSK